MSSKRCPKCFGVQKLSDKFSLNIILIKCYLHARFSLTVTDGQGEMLVMISRVTGLMFIKLYGREMYELYLNLWTVQKLTEKILPDRPESESDLDFFGGPKFSDSDLHFQC